MGFSGLSGQFSAAAGQRPLTTGHFNPKIQVQSVNTANMVDAGKGAVSKMDTAPTRDAAMRTMGQVADTRQDVINTVRNGMIATQGRAFTDQAMGQMVPGDGPSKVAAAATIADPTGVIGGVATAINDIHAQNKHIGNETMRAALADAISAIRNANDPESPMAKARLQPAQDMQAAFADVNPEQLLKYIQTPLDQDPAYTASANIVAALDQVDAQFDAQEARVDAGEHLTAQDITQAAERDDHGFEEILEDRPHMAGPTAHTATHTANQDGPHQAYGADGIQYMSNALTEMPPVQVGGATPAMTALVQNAMIIQTDLAAPSQDRTGSAPSLDQEDALTALARKAEFPEDTAPAAGGNDDPKTAFNSDHGGGMRI